MRVFFFVIAKHPTFVAVAAEQRKCLFAKQFHYVCVRLRWKHIRSSSWDVLPIKNLVRNEAGETNKERVSFDRILTMENYQELVGFMHTYEHQQPVRVYIRAYVRVQTDVFKHEISLRSAISLLTWLCCFYGGGWSIIALLFIAGAAAFLHKSAQLYTYSQSQWQPNKVDRPHWPIKRNG